MAAALGVNDKFDFSLKYTHFDERLPLLWLAARLGVIGLRRVSISHMQQVANPTPWAIPRNAIPMAIVTTSFEYLEWVPLRLADPNIKV